VSNETDEGGSREDVRHAMCERANQGQFGNINFT